MIDLTLFTFIDLAIGAVMLITLFMIAGRLTQIVGCLEGILAHQRLTNVWPIERDGKWVVLAEKFDSRANAVAFIEDYRSRKIQELASDQGRLR